ncbi:MAG: T9SS type A sorting domain-containing protein [Candidatus Eisenbacteria bacterium]|uniref:T9SS type A sorting domain-containing protein n=1 Tax=Eiseniibacteriota bacterium TaxID=2212470 RepID=A0A538T093_UNCEI|nr:MAG: T9SS type A sorting domain-containing protein [Candidatus Eisenbacteria bacterium]
MIQRGRILRCRRAREIQFSLSFDARVSLAVHDVSGRLVVRLLTSRAYPAGRHSVRFPSIRFSSGVYFVKLDTESLRFPNQKVTRTRKMVVVR